MRGDNKGFTLLELLCVLALLGLLTILAVPAVSALGQGKEVELAARELAIDMRQAQQKALTAGWTQRLEFRLNNNDYIIRDGKTGERIVKKLPDGVSYLFIRLPLQGSYRLLSFNRFGSPNRGGTVALTNDTGDHYYVIITPATGRVRVSTTDVE